MQPEAVPEHLGGRECAGYELGGRIILGGLSGCDKALHICLVVNDARGERVRFQTPIPDLGVPYKAFKHQDGPEMDARIAPSWRSTSSPLSDRGHGPAAPLHRCPSIRRRVEKPGPRAQGGPGAIPHGGEREAEGGRRGGGRVHKKTPGWTRWGWVGRGGQGRGVGSLGLRRLPPVVLRLQLAAPP